MNNPEMDVVAAATQQGQRQAALYRSVWRWHFYAGLFVAPFLLLLAVTGALYLFDREIEGVVYADLMDVTPQATTPPASAQEAAVLAAAPGARIIRYIPGRDPASAHEWMLVMPDGSARTFFVDPYDLTVKGSFATDGHLMAVIRALHGHLLAGTLGDRLVELVACWTFVLLVTGLFLWWPRRATLQGTLVPRLKAPGRLWWRDLHAVPAFFSTVLVAFLVLSGLPWSGFWGMQLASLGTLSAATAPTPNFGAEPPRKGAVDPHADHRGNQETPDNGLPWSIRNAQPPAGSGEGPVGIDQIMALMTERGVTGPRLRISYPQGPEGLYTASLVPDRAQGQRTLYIDAADGRVLDDIGWDRYSPLGKIVEWDTMTHMGRQFGLVNQLIGLTACLLIILTIVTGVVMWWKRRPVGEGIAAPKPLAGRRIPWGFWPAIAGLSILFPLMGASLVSVLAIDAGWRKLQAA